MPVLPINFNELLSEHTNHLAEVIARMETKLILSGYDPPYASDIVSGMLIDIVRKGLERRVVMYIAQERVRPADA